MPSRSSSVAPEPSGVKRHSFISVTNSHSSAINFIQNKDDSLFEQVCKMGLVVMVPVIAVIVMASILFSASLSTLQTASTLNNVIEHTLYTAKGIQFLQLERSLTAVFLASQVNNFTAYQKLTVARMNVNGFMESLQLQQPLQFPSDSKVYGSGRDLLVYIEYLRISVDTASSSAILSIMEKYTALNLALIGNALNLSLVPSIIEICPKVTSFGTLSRAIDMVGLQRGIGSAVISACGTTQPERSAFIILSAKYSTMLNTSIQYYPQIRQWFDRNDTYGTLSKSLEKQRRYILNNTKLVVLCSRDKRAALLEGSAWFRTLSSFMEQLTAVQKHIAEEIQQQIGVVQVEAQVNMATFLTVMVGVAVLCTMLSLWYSLELHKINTTIRQFIIKEQLHTEAVKLEKKKTDFLLYQMMPHHIADALKEGQEVIPEWFDLVTVIFTNIFSWAEVSAKSSPHQIVHLLNDLYLRFDRIIEKYEVYKVETIADSYMCVSGLPHKAPNHVQIIARLALEMITFAGTFNISHLPGEPLTLRVGFHSGPVVAGIVGTKMPRYCLFGDTVNTASRMESNSRPLKIQISKTSQVLLEKDGGFVIEYRGHIPIKGKGKMHTYWLVRREEDQQLKKQVQINSQVSQD